MQLCQDTSSTPDRTQRGITTLNGMEEGKDSIERLVEIHDPVEVEAPILESNTHHFKQTQETPLFNSRLIGLINDAANNAN
jgi:hypothetical protein